MSRARVNDRALAVRPTQYVARLKGIREELLSGKYATGFAAKKRLEAVEDLIEVLSK